MKNHDKIECEIEKRMRAKDRKKRKRMRVHGKSVFTLQHLINKPK